MRFYYFCSLVVKKKLYLLTNASNSEIGNNRGLGLIRIIYRHSLEGGTYPTIHISKSRRLANV